METLYNISEFIFKTIWAIVGGTISIAFVGGIIGAFAYMFYYAIKHGLKATMQEFIWR